MELHFCDPGLDYSLDIITEFQQSDLSDWWKDSLFHFYPQLDRTEYERLDASSRFLYSVKSSSISMMRQSPTSATSSDFMPPTG